ncbi:MAG: hypothetical protein FWC75_06595, partial [Oscillospiraceae bacterium]|nr:hypothetical protein [Oscillospiraceae bacterium]
LGCAQSAPKQARQCAVPLGGGAIVYAPVGPTCVFRYPLNCMEMSRNETCLYGFDKYDSIALTGGCLWSW